MSVNYLVKLTFKFCLIHQPIIKNLLYGCNVQQIYRIPVVPEPPNSKKPPKPTHIS